MLHKMGEPITEFDDELRTLFDDMVDTMYEAEGIGLAAQQVGLAKQFCVVDLTGCDPDFEYLLDGAKPPLDLFMPIGMCNPKVEVLEGPVVAYEEGCLSFPDIRGDVERVEKIRCEYLDVYGAPHVIEANGLFGRCIQHEVDHLNGVLFIDRMRKRVLKKIQLPVNQLKATTLRRMKR